MISTRGDVMSLVETQAQDTAFTYNISPNGTCGDWYWEVMRSGDIVARGLAATPVKARADAMRSTRVLHADVESQGCTVPQAFSWGT
jgi:hypothetical protein